MAKGEKRSAARLSAVQALYQMDIAGTPLPEIFAEFESFWMGQEVEGEEYKPAEAAFFRSIVEGVLREQRVLDPEIDATLAGGWPLRRVEAIMRAILRAGGFELRFRRDIPPRVVIAEYVDIAHAFFDKDEVGMVNAVLDALARKLRSDELARKDS
jgi:N utilization substance protein B